MGGEHSGDPAAEAWGLIWQLVLANKQRTMRLAQELDLAPMQLHTLRLLEPGHELPMRALAQSLFCDPSNVTGIVDRLEARGLIERREALHDRRVKILRLTRDGARLRRRMMADLDTPPPELAALPLPAKIALRDVLRQAFELSVAEDAESASIAG
jgi:MarR family transcriptional regulator, organic hydroperoxide resistance regulator